MCIGLNVRCGCIYQMSMLSTHPKNVSTKRQTIDTLTNANSLGTLALVNYRHFARSSDVRPIRLK